MILQNTGGQMTHYHHEQLINGYHVYGGEVVVTMSNLHEVISANGHPLPHNKIHHDLISLSDRHRDGNNGRDNSAATSVSTSVCVCMYLCHV